MLPPKHNIYAPEGYFKFHESYKLKKKLSCEHVKNGMIFGAAPVICDKESPFYKKIHLPGYVLDEDGNYVLTSSQIGGEIGQRQQCSEALNIRQTAIKRPRKAVFLGCFIGHWGHFLLESISRWWALLDKDKYAGYDLCYITIGRQSKSSQKLIDLFGIDRSRLVEIKDNIIYDEVVIPEASSKLNYYWTEEYLQTIEHIIRDISPANYKKVYLSRTKYKDSVFGEKVIERIFGRGGYKIIYPEKMPLEEQIAIIKGASDIACLSGTTAHNLVFAKQKTTCAIMERNSFPNYAQPIINDMKELNTSCIKANCAILPTADGWGPFLVCLNKYLCRFFDHVGLKYTNQEVLSYRQLIPAYLRCWLICYHNHKLIDDILKDNPQLSRLQVENLYSRVEEKLKFLGSRRIRTDKNNNYIVSCFFHLLYKIKCGDSRSLYFRNLQIYHHKRGD